MTASRFFIISAAVIVFGVGLYIVLRWRNAPAAFKAMGFVAIASLAAGVFVGLWSMQMLDTRMRPRTREMTPTPGFRTGAPAASPASRASVPEATPIAPSATRTGLPAAADGILAGYVAQALAQGHPKGAARGDLERWPAVDQGCRLGNYQPTSLLCRAAALVARGWGDVHTIPVAEIAGFCDAGYFESYRKIARALCFEARRGRFSRPPGSPDAGIPETDVAGALGRVTWGIIDANGNDYEWSKVRSRCTEGVYASASPVCEADTIHEGRGKAGARVPYSVVASFCDVGLIHQDSEVCSAAYRALTIEE